MVLTVHRWFANKSCPGSWMYARMGDLASKVTAQLGGSKQEETPAVTDTEKTIVTPFFPPCTVLPAPNPPSGNNVPQRSFKRTK